MKDKLEIVYVSDVVKDRVIVEIQYNDMILCQLNKDKGTNNIEIELYYGYYAEDSEETLIFPFDQFLDVLNKAKQAMIDA